MIFRCALIPKFTRRNAFDWCELDQWKQAKSSRPAPKFWAALTVRSQRGFRLGRILDLHKQELSIPGFSSRRQQTLAPLGPYFQRMSGMQSQMVRPLPILRPDSGRGMAKPGPLLCSLRQTAETGNACGLRLHLQSFQWRRAMDKDTRLAILSLCEVLRIDEKHVRDEDLVAPDSRRTGESPRTQLPGGV
jgi:hypothetical protein